MKKRVLMIQKLLSRKRRLTMKTIIGISILFILFAIPAFAQDYAITCHPVIISGKMVDDSYQTSPVKLTDLTLVIYGYLYSDTADGISAELYNQNDDLLVSFSGNIVWNATYTKANIMGTLERVDEADTNNRAFYLDGILKSSRNKFVLSAKGGETDTHHQTGYPFVASFSKISSSSCYYEPL
jgi:sensor domain CHASE-containing protein